MLKIWLTWLQPSLGILGTALVLCNPIAAYAATKPATTNTTAKKPVQLTKWSTVRSNGTRIDSELSNGIAITPDLAVRQIAIGALTTGTIQAPTFIARTTPIAKTTPISKVRQLKNPLGNSFASPTAKKAQKLATIVKPGQINSVAEALARASKPLPPVPVPGLFIGNSDVKVAKQVLPTAKPLAQAIASAEIGAPTPLSAMMGTKPTAADPFPVVRPELMQQIQRKSATMASAPTKVISAPKSLDPIATIPPIKPDKAAAVKAAADIKAIAPNSLDPIAAIPSGLQRLLGNDINGIQTIVTTPVAKPATAKANPTVALKQIISPEVTGTTVTTASLQLATAQAYTSVPKFNIPGEKMLTAQSKLAAAMPKFDIPGETIVASKAAKSAANVLVTKSVRKPFVTANVRKNNHVEIANERFNPVANPAWVAADLRNNLGGLILGSQPQATTSQRVIGASTFSDRLTKITGNGLPTRTLADFQ